MSDSDSIHIDTSNSDDILVNYEEDPEEIKCCFCCSGFCITFQCIMYANGMLILPVAIGAMVFLIVTRNLFTIIFFSITWFILVVSFIGLAKICLLPNYSQVQSVAVNSGIGSVA